MVVAIIPICRHVSSSMWSVRVRHRHLYAVPHHREELMSCLQFGPCEQFKKNRKTHVHFQQCIHQLVLHQLRAMGDADYRFRVLHSLSMFLIRDESHLFQWWIGWHCPRTWTWYERRMVVLRKWTTTWGCSLWVWRGRGRNWRHFSRCVMENDRIVFGRDRVNSVLRFAHKRYGIYCFLANSMELGFQGEMGEEKTHIWKPPIHITP